MRLAEACIKTINYLQDKYPDEPIKAWVESVPADEQEREAVKRKLTDSIREYFRNPEEFMELGLFN